METVKDFINNRKERPREVSGSFKMVCKYSIHFLYAPSGDFSGGTSLPHTSGPRMSVHSLLLSSAQDIPPDGVWVPFSGGTARVTVSTVGKSYRAVESSLTKQDGNECLPTRGCPAACEPSLRKRSKAWL